METFQVMTPHCGLMEVRKTEPGFVVFNCCFRGGADAPDSGGLVLCLMAYGTLPDHVCLRVSLLFSLILQAFRTTSLEPITL